MQGDIDDGTHSELQSHLYSLLEMKRERLGERAQPDLAVPVPAIAWLSGMGGNVKTGSKL